MALRIEAVTVCVDYADFLEITLPGIRRAVDDLVVVTSPADRRTRELCRSRGVRTVVTTAMFDHGRKFSLGAAINAGLRLLDPDDWVLVVDADIVLPTWTRETLEGAELSPRKLYGVDRVHCRGWHTWRRFQATPRALLGWETVFLRDFPIGARIQVPSAIAGIAGGGYVPCGYFQLWNAGCTGVCDHPADERGTAEGSDILHSLRWLRHERELIPDLVAIELGTDQPGEVGVNWTGRRTPEFSAEGGPYRR